MRYASWSAALSLLLGCGTMQPAVPATLTLTAAAVAGPPQTAASPAEAPTLQSPVPLLPCYYVWATRELPELSTALRARMVGAGEALDARAYAFGEECHSDSGEITFLAMETDFRVRVSVISLGNEEAVGNALNAAMVAIVAIPPEQIVGARPGRVDFEFTADGSDSLRLSIDIARFRQEAVGLKGAALLRHFQVSP